MDRKNSVTKSNSKTVPDEFLTGKLPPQAIELEEAVLGALMIEKRAIQEVIDFLQSDHFYKDANKLIYQSILNLHHKSDPIDILTVTNQLRSDGTMENCGGPYYITQLTDRVASAANIEFHARVIEQKYIQRELIRIGSDLQREGFEETSDAFEMIDKLTSVISKLTPENKTYMTWKQQLDNGRQRLEQTNRETGITGVPSGYNNLDRITHGFQKTDLIILAARPGMGKTTFTWEMAKNAATAGYPVDYYSMEMSAEQLVYKSISSQANFDLEKMKYSELNHLDWKLINQAISDLYDLPIHLNDSAALKASELYRLIGQGVLKRKTRLVIIDYLQLINGREAWAEKGNRDIEIGQITRTLKRAAKDFNVPVIALSQLGRSVEQRGGDKIPLLSDLRESGNIEQDADVVGFIYRPEYYGFFEDSEGNSTQGLTQIIIAKHRNGITDTCLLRFVGSKSKFEDYRKEYFI